MQDAYYFCLGGAVGEHAAFGRPTGYRCTADEVPVATERLLRTYLNLRESASENLRQFFARHSDEELRGFLAGRAEIAAVARDGVAQGRVPMAI